VGIPARALGLDAATLRIMRWGMGSWNRTRLLNILGGTMTAALQMDYAPILRSAAFFSIRLKQPVSSSDERVKMLLRAGQQVQRFWLTATRLGLAMQPALAILIFSHYGEKGIAFTTEASMQEKAKMLASAFKRAFGAEPDSFVFMGRIGEARPRDKVCRSTRLSLDELMAVPKSARDHADGRPTTEAA
jgi:hypothetical protein